MNQNDQGKTIEMIHFGRNKLHLLFQSVLSLYIALLVVSVHESAHALSWSVRLRNFYVSRYLPQLGRLMDDNYRVQVATFVLVWVLAALIFLSLLSGSRLRFLSSGMELFGGICALLALPIGCFYQGHTQLFLEVELVAAFVGLLLWTYGKTLTSTWLNVVLVALHFGLWTIFCSHQSFGGWILLWPGWHWAWGIYDLAWIAYPLLGVCSMMLWGICLRRTRQAA
jgi:hypothetical protein